MNRFGSGLVALLLGLAPLVSARAAASVGLAGTTARAPQLFQKFCIECHGTDKPEADLSFPRLLAEPTVGPRADQWEKIVQMLEAGEMPPPEAKLHPAAPERAAAAAWVRSSLQAYADAHAGEPGRVTIRRLTSGEYAYAIRDLTGVDLKVGIEASSDSVGGEGFSNFGDVQFVEDASIERYLEAAKLVADHAVIGAGPLEFYSDPGRTGMELFALNRINEIHANHGFRVVSGEGGKPFGLDRYGKAFYVAWQFKHRAALGMPRATLRELAAAEGITERFAEHIWTVVNRPDLSYPSREMVDFWKTIPAPTADREKSRTQARAGCDELYQYLVTWPSWFFGRGDVAAGGAGDESPLVFDDKSLKAEPTHAYSYALGGAAGGRGGRGRGGAGGGGAEVGGTAAPAPAVAPLKIFLSMENLNPRPGVKPVVIWRNARVVTRGAAGGGGGGGGARGVRGNRRGGAAAVAAEQAAAELAAAAAAAEANATAVAGGGRRGAAAGPILSEQPLRELLAPAQVRALAFGRSPDGRTLGPDDFATTGTVALEITPPTGGGAATLEVEVELGADRNGVVRLVISNNAEGVVPARGGQARVLLGDPASAGYRAFRAGMAEYVSLLPPNSHGEANPADKDPVPLPFDSTYNTPEHDAFVNNVKYQRTDAFLAANMVDALERVRLEQAWNTLFVSFPYHTAYLGLLAEHYGLKLKSDRIQDLGPAQLAALPTEARPHFAALRAHYDGVMKAQAAAEPGHIEDALALASRAWRRPLTAAEKTSLRAFYQRSRTANGLNHDGAVRALIARILASPSFLYRVETVASSAEKPLDGWEMASRMSFFLWASIPDDELRRAAAAGELAKPALLAKQVKRMTADPKARRLATEFFGQWLGFYHFDEYRGVDTARFPEFTEEVREAMYDEAVSTFEHLVRQERPLREMLSADYTFLNQPLAKFYGIEKELPVGRVVRVDGASAFNRGGVLRLGSVLTVTSAPLRTSPVKRGDWILRRILGTPTPPPPADAGTIPRDDKAFKGRTLRETLAEHKRNAACAACHLKIDPLGFPLEGFDAVGRTREAYQDGKPVDTTGEFADKSTITGTDGLLKYLGTQEPQVLRTLGRKMLGYALGRTVLASDRPLLDEMAAAGSGATFSDLAVKIVTSRQFRNHAAGDEPTGQPARAAANLSPATPASAPRSP
jgi:mono/diheme cytochrome c family protein